MKIWLGTTQYNKIKHNYPIDASVLNRPTTLYDFCGFTINSVVYVPSLEYPNIIAFFTAISPALLTPNNYTFIIIDDSTTDYNPNINPCYANAQNYSFSFLFFTFFTIFYFII